jgi:hypothetical protein
VLVSLDGYTRCPCHIFVLKFSSVVSDTDRHLRNSSSVPRKH